MIDVHQHFFPPAFLDQARDQIAADALDMDRILGWTPERAVAAMDAAGISTSVISVCPPGPQSPAEARACNGYGRRMVLDHPGRFLQLAALPMPDARASVVELSYAFDELGVAGVSLFTSYGDAWLGDPPYEAVLAALDRRAGVVHVHPTSVPARGRLPRSLLEFPFDTTRAIANYVFGGAALRTPRVRPIFAHGGGALPAVISRLRAFATMHPPAAAAAPQGVDAMLARFHYDITFAAAPVQLAALRGVVPDSQLLFGSDLPFMPAAATVSQFAAAPHSAELRDAVMHDNARRLFGVTGG